MVNSEHRDATRKKVRRASTSSCAHHHVRLDNRSISAFSAQAIFSANNCNAHVPCDVAYSETEEILRPRGSDGEVSIVLKERGRGEEQREREDCTPGELEDGHEEHAGGRAEEEEHLLPFILFSFCPTSSQIYNSTSEPLIL